MIVRTTRVLIEVVAASLLGIMLLVGVSAWRLSQGPVPLNFLTPHLEQALNDQGAPFRVTFEKTILAWAGWDRTLDIRIVGVRARAGDGKLIARVPEISVSVSVRALFKGVVAPTSLDLIGGSLQLVRRRTGEMALTFGDLTDREEDAPGPNVFAILMNDLSADPSPERPVSYLRRVSILDARLRVDDRATGVVWGAPQTDIILLRDKDEFQGTFFTKLDIGGSVTTVNGAASWKPKSDVIRIESEISGVRTDRIAEKLPLLKGLESLRLDVRGTVGLTISLGGALKRANFDLVAKKGQITYSAFWPNGLPVKSAELRGSYDGDKGSLEIENLTANLNGPVLSGRTTVLKLGQGLAVDGLLEVDRMTLEQLGHYWPRSIGAAPRGWVIANMPAGNVEDTQATLSLRIPDLTKGEIKVESFSGKLRLSKTTIHHVKGLPPVQNIAANAVFSHDRFIATVRSGFADTLSVKSASVRLTNLDTDSERADIDVTLEGDLEDALAMIDRPPLGFVSQLGMRPAGVSGRTVTDLKFIFPLSRSVDLSAVQISARSDLTDIAMPQFFFGKPISADRLVLKVDKSGLELNGAARVGSVPARIKWTERFDEKDSFKRRYEAQAVLDDRERKALGLPDLGPYVNGPVAVDLSYLKSARGKTELALKMVLNNTVLWLPGLRWRKEAGAEGIVWLTVDLKPDNSFRIRQFDMRTPTLSASGSMEFDTSKTMSRLTVGKFNHGRTTASGTVTPNPDGGFNVDVVGREFDATPFLEDDDTAGQTSPGLPKLHIRAKLDKVWIDKSRSFDRLTGELVRGDAGWRTVDATGHVGTDHEVKLTYEAAPVPRLTVRAADAGETLRALEVLDTMRGGKLSLTARKSDKTKPEAWIGALDVTDFRMVKAPLLAKVLSNLSLTGIQNNLAGRGIQFAKLDIPFSYENKIFTIGNARTVGSEIGITAEGQVDGAKDAISLKGTIVPAYTINSVLGNIPVLGTLLTGKEGSGVFAATYRISGPVDEPLITVNPLAALAPGFLRNLIGIFDGSVKPDAGTSSTISDTN